MSTKWKSEIKWILFIGVCALVLTFIILSQFQNYNWTLGFQHSGLLWILWIFISLLGIIGGINYFIRFLISKEYNGLKNQLTLIILSISVIGIYGIAKVANGLEKYFIPTSEKTEYGFTIYPPLTADPEQWEQLNELKNHAKTAYGLMFLMIILLIITAVITWKRKKTAPNNT